MMDAKIALRTTLYGVSYGANTNDPDCEEE
jgi:hypothetical protein